MKNNTKLLSSLPCTSYIVQASPQSTISSSITSTALAEEMVYDTYITLRDLQPDTQYKIRIAAVNEAGVSDFNEVTGETLSMCFARAMDFQKERVTVVCPAGCSKHQEYIYGTREYTDDSLICAAAIHDGRLNGDRGGEVTLVKRSGMPHYLGKWAHI